jgi:hypothetical protein
MIRALALFVAATTVRGADIPLHLHAVRGAEVCMDGDGIIVARSDPPGEIVRVPLRGAPISISLPRSDVSWTVHAETQRCWSDTARVSPPGGDVTVQLFPAAELHGSLTGKLDRPPSTVEATLVPMPPASGAADAHLQEQLVECSLEYPRWHCRVPAGVQFDLRLHVPGFAPLYYWNILASSHESRELEVRRLDRGASVSGWVQGPEKKPVEGAAVILAPFQGDTSSRLEKDPRRLSTKTNRRGFFQLAGIGAGDYQIVSHARGLSTVVVPLVTLREDEALIWPRPITHADLASLEVALQPLTDGAEAWIVELTEQTPVPGEPQKPPLRLVPINGMWSARGLRADVYRVAVRNGRNAVLERASVDLSAGGAKRIDLTIKSIVVEGVLRFAGRPLQAELSFSNESGKRVPATSDDEGRFEVSLPGAGEWMPTVYYPTRAHGASVAARVITIPDHEGPVRVEIELPGARLSGTVVTPDGIPTKAAVRLWHDRRMVAQQVTSDDGTFDFIGIAQGAYTAEALAKKASTPHPVALTLTEDETSELRLVIEPYRMAEGTILTPQGAPASGASVELSVDGGNAWVERISDAAGQFRYAVPADAPAVDMLVRTYAYPTRLLSIPVAALAEPIVIRLQPQGGLLLVRGSRTTMLLTTEIRAPFWMLFFPEPFGRFNGAVHLEPGPYIVCPSPQSDVSICKRVWIASGTESFVDFTNMERP